jgi:AcrR family transcriptional regulator
VARLTRAEAQALNRAKILTAARDEFAERGFRDVKIDEIADRAELTRGAVYSNFPGKRALYFAVLAHEPVDLPTLRPATTVKEALSSFAMVSVRQNSRLAADAPDSRRGVLAQGICPAHALERGHARAGAGEHAAGRRLAVPAGAAGDDGPDHLAGSSAAR